VSLHASDVARVAALVVAVAAMPLAASMRQSAAALPALLDSYLTKHVKMSAQQRGQLLAGQPVTQMLDADPSREVGVFGAVWVNASPAQYVALAQDIERFESGGSFRVTKRISDPPRLEDFAALELPADDVAALRTCRVGDCELKLGESTLNRLQREIDWKKPTAKDDVEALARRQALQYVIGYLEGGNAQLAVYRDDTRPTFVAQEFASMIDRLPAMSEYVPDLKRYLLDFPKATLAKSSSFLYWQEAQFGLKPTIRINHVVITEQPTHVAMASKMIYASHYFWTALELRVLVPDPARGAGFWFASVNRSRSDGLSGFTGKIIRGKVRGEAEKGMAAALRAVKRRLERPAA
jgi:hypothetical protein